MFHVPVNGLGGKSFQNWANRLPVRLYGWSGGDMLPCLSGYPRDGLASHGANLPFMAGTWGGPEFWRQGSAALTRWSINHVGLRLYTEGVEIRRLREKLTAGG